jgi:hypothetical protein
MNDELTKLERKVYRYVAGVAFGVDLYLTLLVKAGSIPNSFWIDITGFLMLMIAVVFGWGCNKNTRVLDLRKFSKEQ